MMQALISFVYGAVVTVVVTLMLTVPYWGG